MHKNKNNIFTHFKIQYKRKLFPFTKSDLISHTSKEVLKTLEENNFGKSTLHLTKQKRNNNYYLSKIIGLTILKF